MKMTEKEGAALSNTLSSQRHKGNHRLTDDQSTFV